MEDDLKQNGRQPQKNEMEDDLNINGRRTNQPKST